MSLWMFFGSLIPGLCMAFVVGSRFGGTARGWLARIGFVAVASVTAGLLYWTYHRLDQTTTTLVVFGLLVCAGAVAFSIDGLIENNAPPTPQIRDDILGKHTNLAYRREPRGKRALDIVAASVGIVVTLPLWFVVALLIWFNEPGPIFFTKNSVGRGGITFRELKFRSMHYGAERNTGPVVATLEDPRTLAIGGPLRQWHLDELPELLNVLTGTMSVVGPRPLRALVVRRDLVEVPGFAERHTVRPGIACIAQIEKCHVPAAERLTKDLIYIQRMSLGYDLRLLVRAVVTTVLGKREPAPLQIGSTWPTEAFSDSASDSQPMQSLVATPVGPGADGRMLDPSVDSTTPLRARIKGAFGGLTGEEIVYGETTAGAERDLDDAIDMPREIVSRQDTVESVRPAEAPSSSDREPSAGGERHPRREWPPV